MATVVCAPFSANSRKLKIKSWEKKVGAHVIVGQVLLTFESNGVILKKSCPKTGVLIKILRNVGEEVEGDEPVGLIVEPGELPKPKDTEQTDNTAAGAAIDKETEGTVLEIKNGIAKIDAEMKEVGALSGKISSKRPFVITFSGRFKTGKSSLLNAVLGDTLLPTKATTATTVVTKIVYGSRKQAWLCEEGSKRPIPIGKAQDIILNHQVTDLSNPVEIIFEAPIPWLSRDVELRDTPGMDDSAQNGLLEAVAMKSLADTDLCVCVYDAGAFPSGRERERTKDIYKALNGDIVYVVNCTNHLNSLEGLRLVEDTAKHIFESMNYRIRGTGQYFMVCSAPGMVYFDGFDSWLEHAAGRPGAAFRAKVRENSAEGKLAGKREECLSRASAYKDILEKQKVKIMKKHQDALTKAQDRIMSDAKKKANDLKQSIPFLNDKFFDESALSGMLSEEYAGGAGLTQYNNSYEELSKQVTREHFERRFQYVRDGWCPYLSGSDRYFIDEAINSLSFPDKHSVTVTATTQEKNRWTVGGAILGGVLTLATGGAALPFLIGGAAAGRLIGATDNSVDDSVANTVKFVQTTLVPMLRGAFEEKLRAVANKFVLEAKAMKCTSGYESSLAALCGLELELSRRIQKWSSPVS